MLNKKILVDGSKLTQKSVLINPYRKKLHDYLQKKRCANFTEIKKQIFSKNNSNEGSAGQLVWHLEMLLKFNIIKKIKIKNSSIFMPFDVDENQIILSILLKDEIDQEIVKLLMKHNNIKKNEVHKHLDEYREKIYYRINKLIEYDIIHLNQVENNTIFINPEKIELITLVIKENSEKKALMKGGNINNI